jgi:uncharacterized protein YodC (DUF2158 family)
MMKPGDVVQLKSGGPPMTVESVEPNGVICSWFDAKNRKNDRFDEVALVPVGANRPLRPF